MRNRKVTVTDTQKEEYITWSNSISLPFTVKNVFLNYIEYGNFDLTKNRQFFSLKM